MAPGGLVPRLAGLEHGGGPVVHFVVRGAFDHDPGHGGGAVPVRWGGAVGGEGDAQCGDGFSGDVAQGELVDGLDGGDGPAMGEQGSWLTRCCSFKLGGVLLDVRVGDRPCVVNRIGNCLCVWVRVH